jgi:hypothetical protein
MPAASRWGAHIHPIELDPSVRGLRPRRPRQSYDEFGSVAPLEQQSIQHESRVEAARRPGADSRHLVDDPAEPLGIDVKVASVDLPREAIDHLRQGMTSHHPAYPCVRHPDVRGESDLGRERERCSCGVTGATHPVPRISSGREIGSPGVRTNRPGDVLPGTIIRGGASDQAVAPAGVPPPMGRLVRTTQSISPSCITTFIR